MYMYMSCTCSIHEYTVQCTVYGCNMYNVQCTCAIYTMYSVRVQYVQCTVYGCNMYDVQCATRLCWRRRMTFGFYLQSACSWLVAARQPSTTISSTATPTPASSCRPRPCSTSHVPPVASTVAWRVEPKSANQRSANSSQVVGTFSGVGVAWRGPG